MNRPSIISLPMAVRVYTESTEPSEAFRRSIRPPRPDALLVFDTETTTDPRQTLLFGSYRFIESGRCIEEGVFYPEDLRIADRRTLQQYVAKHAADTAKDGTPQIHLLTLKQFLKTLHEAAYRGQCLLIGFNLPYDLSRLAFSAAKARGRFAGGFSFVLWTYRDREGVEKPYNHRPRILIKHIDSKRALKRFASPYDPDFNDLVLAGCGKKVRSRESCLPLEL